MDWIGIYNLSLILMSLIWAVNSLFTQAEHYFYFNSIIVLIGFEIYFGKIGRMLIAILSGG